MIIFRIVAVAVLIAFQIFSFTQLWSAWRSGTVYVRKLGMIGVADNHAAWTQHMALYMLGAASAVYLLFRVWRWRRPG